MLNIVFIRGPGMRQGNAGGAAQREIRNRSRIDRQRNSGRNRPGTKLGKEMESYITTGRLAPRPGGDRHDRRLHRGAQTRERQHFRRLSPHDAPGRGVRPDAVRTGVEGRCHDLHGRSRRGAGKTHPAPGQRVRASGRRFGGGDPRPYQSISRTDGRRRGLYAKQGKFADINGLGTMDEVFDRICRSSIPFGSNSDLIHIYFTGFLSKESRCFVPFRKKNFSRSPRKTRLTPDTPDKRHAPPSFRPNAPAPTVPVGKQPGGSGTENIPIYINKSCRQ